MTKQERIAEYVSAELSRGHPKTQEDPTETVAKQLRN